MHERTQGKKLFWPLLLRFFGILGAVCVFCVLCNVFNWMYYQEDFWTRSLWHNFYEDEGKIENLYLGSSHVYCGINPILLDSINGKYNFNLSSHGQQLNGTYYLLKEANKENELSHVYVEMYYIYSTKDNFNMGKDPIDIRQDRNWTNSDYMKFSFNKIAYMLSMGGAESYVDICFPFVRYRKYLDDLNFVRETLEQKKDYFIYRYQEKGKNSYGTYRERGQRYSTEVLNDEDRNFEQTRILGEDCLAEKSKEYLIKIIKYCDKQNIPITLFVSPIDELQLISTEQYDCYVNEIREIASEYDLEFYDFNLAKEEYLPIHQNQYFRDIGHLNSEGAMIFTPFFEKVVNGDVSENSIYFYSSYKEKLQNLSPTIYGLYYRNEGQNKILKIASNRENGLEYRIILTSNDGTTYTIQDFSDNKTFSISKQEQGVCTIVARLQESGEVIKTLEVNY